MNSKFYLSPSFGFVLLRRNFLLSSHYCCVQRFFVDGLGCVLSRIRLVPCITLAYWNVQAFQWMVFECASCLLASVCVCNANVLG